MKSKIHVVSTKKLSDDLIRSMESADIRVTQHNFIQKEMVDQSGFKQNSIHPVIVLTSQTAAHAWIEMMNKFRLDPSLYQIYCLPSCAKALANQPGAKIAMVDKDAVSLAYSIVKDKSISKVTFICGNLRREELPEKLSEKGIVVEEIIAYKTKLTSFKIQEDYHGVLFFSPSAIDSYLLMNPAITCDAFCLGQTTANHAQETGFLKIQVADTPTPESMVGKVINYYINQGTYAQK
jgi:uroporphyrinogen-III synthase